MMLFFKTIPIIKGLGRNMMLMKNNIRVYRSTNAKIYKYLTKQVTIK